ncbi:proline-rich domain-containing protein [Kitasatospora sp. NPDC059577]|uniref:proline-rich domain-containing protein n=1 Tax=Kitasatospora sp. NPDC059577 TaxID=3346873 RepID=UPI00368AC2B0
MPPAVGSWGTGTPYAPQSPVHRLLTGADWRPALRAAVAPTLVLLLAALIAAVPSDYQYEYRFRSPDFGDRFGATLSMALNALGAPFRIGYQSPLSRGHAERMDIVLRVAPMTVTVLWCLALWRGLRAGLRRHKAVVGQLTRAQAAGEALRTALVLAGVTTVLWAVGGTTWQPRDTFDVPDYTGTSGQDLSRPVITAGAGWLEAVGWTLLLAGLLAFVVHGTDALRWAAWRSRSVRGWAVAALSAGQAMAVSVALSAVAAFVLVAANSTSGGQVGLALAFLPNLGLALLGFGSGATFQAHSGLTGGETSWGKRSEDLNLSFFDLHDQVTADWRWAGLLALVAAGTLGWTAHRRQLDAADRLRLAAVHAAALTVLMAVAGAMVTRTSSMAGWSRTSDLQVSQENAVGLTFLTVLAANAVWALAGALLVPPLLAAVRGGGAGAGYAKGPYGGASYDGAPGGAAPHPYTPLPPVPSEVPPVPASPHGVPAHGVPAQAGPRQDVPGGGAPAHDVPLRAAAPQDGPPAPGSGVSEVLGSHEAPPTPAAGTRAGAPTVADVPSPRGEEPVDPSVWREHP